MRKLFSPLRCLILMAILCAGFVFALGQTYTVCASGCDFTSLKDALLAPGLGSDTVELTSGYVYNAATEGTSLTVPDDVVIQCVAGADTFGDSTEDRVTINLGSDETVQNCTFDNVDLNANSQTNLNFTGNTFTGATTFTPVISIINSDTFDISDNIGEFYMHIATSDNGTIDNNDMSCNYDTGSITGCLYLGGTVVPALDPTDPAQIPNNVAITNNIFENINTNGGTLWVEIWAGQNISFTGNTLRSAVIMGNGTNEMLLVSDSQIDIEHNWFFMPEKTGAADQPTDAIRAYIDEGQQDLNINHNTIIHSEPPASPITVPGACLRVYDPGIHTLSVANISYNYNNCYNGHTSDYAANVYIDRTDVAVTLTLNFTNHHNGNYNISAPIEDSDDEYTTLDSTTTTLNPTFRTENASGADDYSLSPISNYLDVDGSLDIGAEEMVRVSTYTFDDNCTVDYATCYSNLTSTLTAAARSDDVVTLAAGTYGIINLPSNINNITIGGVGTSTIIDATGESHGFSAQYLSNSHINNLVFENATVSTSQYRMFSYAGSAGGTDYNASGIYSMYAAGPACGTNVVLNTAPYTDMTGVDGIGTSDIGLYLADFSGYTLYIPNSTAADPSEIEANCGLPAFVFTHFVPNVFILQPDNSYVYNSADVASAGITFLGDGSDPFLTKYDVTAAGIYLLDSSDNQFSDINFSGNTNDLIIDGGSSDNRFIEMVFDAATSDVVSNTNSSNGLYDSTFDFNALDVNSTGALDIYWTLNATVRNSVGLTPISGASIEVTGDDTSPINSLTTDGSGQDSDYIRATSITSADTPPVATSGGLNPLVFTVSKTGFTTQVITETISAIKNLVVDLVAVPTAPNVTVNQAGGQSDPTTSSSISFTAAFDQAISVGTFTCGDVTVTNGTCSGITSAGGNNYTIAVTATTYGAVTASIPAGGVSNSGLTFTNNISTSTDNSVTYIPNPLNVTANQSIGQADPTASSTISFTVAFDRPINAATFTCGSGAIFLTNGLCHSVVSAGGNTYTVIVHASSVGVVTINVGAGLVSDSGGFTTNNVSTSTDNSVTYAPPTSPEVTIDQASGQSDPTSNPNILFTAVFDQAISVGTFTCDDILMTNGTCIDITSAGGNSYTVAVTAAAPGTVVANVDAGGVSDSGLSMTNNASTSSDNGVTYTPATSSGGSGPSGGGNIIPDGSGGGSPALNSAYGGSICSLLEKYGSIEAMVLDGPNTRKKITQIALALNCISRSLIETDQYQKIFSDVNYKRPSVYTPVIETALHDDIVTPLRGYFEPEKITTRAETFAIMMAAACIYDRTPWEEVWQPRLHKEAFELGITTRTWANFKPNEDITTPELLKVVNRVLNKMGQVSLCD